MIAQGEWEVAHVLAVPLGDDPVALVEVAVTNHGAKTATVRWAEVAEGSGLVRQHCL